MTLVCTPDEFIAASYLERRKLVRAQVEAEPKAHRQFAFALRSETTACGWAGCLLGWTWILSGAKGSVSSTAEAQVPEQPVALLGLSDADAAAIYCCPSEAEALDLLADAEVVAQ